MFFLFFVPRSLLAKEDPRVQGCCTGQPPGTYCFDTGQSPRCGLAGDLLAWGGTCVTGGGRAVEGLLRGCGGEKNLRTTKLTSTSISRVQTKSKTRTKTKLGGPLYVKGRNQGQVKAASSDSTCLLDQIDSNRSMHSNTR